MKTKKGTKRALLGSVIVMLLCLAMLIGSTFAWFTDSAGTAQNTIQAGNLDIDIQDKDGNSLDGKPLKFVKEDGSEITGTILWEPGCTYNLQTFRIVNNGSLALKYMVSISGINGSEKLNEAIEWTMTDGTTPLQLGTELKLAPKGQEGASTGLYTISGHMKESAGNEYQNESITEIAITVVATQDTVESDSFGNTYDKNAVYPVVGATAVKNALKKGGTVILGDDVTYNLTTNPDIDTKGERTVIGSKTVTLDLAGKTITFDSNEGNNNFAAFYVNSGKGSLTVNGEGTIDATATTGAYCFHLMGGKISQPTLTINGGTYRGNPTAVNVQYGTAYINGGFFHCAPDGNGLNGFTLNCIDANYPKYANIIVTGGTFVNFNPANNAAEGAGTNFVKEGYKVVSETKENGDIWYTVVPES